MRSRYPRNHINEDHYPIKRVVVFFLFIQGSKKELIVRHTFENHPKHEILSYTRTDEKTNSDIITEFAFFFSHVFFFKFYENNKRFIGGMKENARVVF